MTHAAAGWVSLKASNGDVILKQTPVIWWTGGRDPSYLLEGQEWRYVSDRWKVVSVGGPESAAAAAAAAASPAAMAAAMATSHEGKEQGEGSEVTIDLVPRYVLPSSSTY
jgi:hypothetical protein